MNTLQPGDSCAFVVFGAMGDLTTRKLLPALYQRFSSRGDGEWAAKVLSAMRHAFGGHEEPKP